MFSPTLKKGSAELLILSLLENQQRHGYELAKLISQRSGERLIFQASSLYPVLFRMEKKGWIRGRWGPSVWACRSHSLPSLPDPTKVRESG